MGCYFRQAVLEVLGEQMTEEEEALCRLFSKILIKNGTTERGERLETDAYFRRISFSIRRRRLAERIDRLLQPRLGDRVALSKDVWYYHQFIEGWPVATLIDFGGRSRQLGYEHSIGDRDCAHYLGSITLFSWLGIGGQLDWEYLTKEDVGQAVLDFEAICMHFINALPQILSGIPPEAGSPTRAIKPGENQAPSFF